MKYECRIVVIRHAWHKARVLILKFTQMKRFFFNSKDCRNTNEILPNHNVSLIYTKKTFKAFTSLYSSQTELKCLRYIRIANFQRCLQVDVLSKHFSNACDHRKQQWCVGHG